MAETERIRANNSATVKRADMPHSIEAEQALLGCMMLDTKIQLETVTSLKDEDFYSEAHRTIFSAMYSLIASNQPVDFVTLSDALEKDGKLTSVGGTEYLTGLTDVMPSTANYMKYFDIVKSNSQLRRIISGASEIIKESEKSTDCNSALAFAEKTIYDISETADTGVMEKINKIIPDVMNTFDELSKDKSSLKGIKTGYRSLDYLLNGLHKSDLMILAARPAVGKTSFAMNIVENVALQGYTCAVFSLEMSKEQIVQRMICSVANVSMEHATKGELSAKEWVAIEKARKALSESKIYIDDSAMITPQQALSKCRRLKSRAGLDFVMIDYVQLMSPEKTRNSDNRQQEITDISRNLKILAKELDVPVLALSQLSRAVEKENRRPQLADLRESGAIEQDADIVMFIHRPDKALKDRKEIEKGNVQENVAEILIEKHRAGPTGMVKLYFRGECTKFVNLSENGEPEGEGVYKTQQPVERPDFSDANSVSGSVDFGNPPPFDADGFPEPPPEEEKPIKSESVDDDIFG